MRLGGAVFPEGHEDPGEWAAAVKREGYRAAFCPVSLGVAEDVVRAYAAAAQRHDIIIAEVGAWSNPLAADDAVRGAALERCRQGLALADAIGARCCVNISGSRGAKWDGPCAGNLTRDTFDLIVETVRGIIDAVKPRRTFYTLETMPWMYPHDAGSYRGLIRAIDRRAFAVHFDPVNLVSSPCLYFRNGEMIRDFVARLGSCIRSCHAKDVRLQERLTVHLDEVRPGLGGLDYRTLLGELARMDADMPLMLEHLADEGEYRLAAGHIRAVAAEEGVML